MVRCSISGASVLPDDSASDRGLHSDYSGKERLRDVPHPRRTGYESSQRLSHTAASQPCDRR